VLLQLQVHLEVEVNFNFKFKFNYKVFKKRFYRCVQRISGYFCL